MGSVSVSSRRARGRPRSPWQGVAVSSMPARVLEQVAHAHRAARRARPRARIRRATARASTRDQTWTRILASVQWNIGEKGPTRWRSFSWRKSGLDGFLGAVTTMVSGGVLDGLVAEEDPLAEELCFERGAGLRAHAEDDPAGESPVRVVETTRDSHRGLRIWAISASTFSFALRVFPRARRAASSESWRFALRGSGRSPGTASRGGSLSGRRPGGVPCRRRPSGSRTRRGRGSALHRRPGSALCPRRGGRGGPM